MTEIADQTIKEDVDKKDFSTAFKDIYKDLSDQKDQGQWQNNADFANKVLTDSKLLPGITIVGVDTQVGDNGTGLIVKDQRNGSVTETYTLDPETGIARSEKGQIEAIFYPNGTVQRFDYKDGKLSGVSDASGRYYEVGPDGTAKYFDDKNGEWVTAQGKMKIDQKTGEITIENADKTKEVHRPDGSSVKFDGAHTDANGNPRVTEVTFAYDPNNKNERGTMKFDYDPASGKLITVTDQSKNVWTNVDGKWQTTRDGKTFVSDADFSVDKYGVVTIAHKNADGTTKTNEIYNPNGTCEKTTKDGTRLQFDKNNNLVSVQDKGGTARNIRYDHGEPSEVDVPGGTYRKTGDKWQMTDRDGNPIPGVDQPLSIKTFPDGTVVLFMKEKQVTIAPNGKATSAKYDPRGR